MGTGTEADRAGDEHGASGPENLARGICELTLQTADPDALAAFYAAVFGFPVLSREDDRIWLACGQQARLGLWAPGEKEFGDEGGRHVHHAYSVHPGALLRIAARLQGLGVEHRGPVEHEGGDRSLYFEDPEGNVVEAWDFFARAGDVDDLAAPD